METGSAIQEHKDHTPRLVQSQHVHQQVHGAGRIGKINTKVALKVTKYVGSMWCAYAFVLLALISFPAAIGSSDPIIIVAWVAQTFIQLVLLPIIIVGQNVQQAANDERALADHKTLTAVHTLSSEIHTINEQQTEILLQLKVGGKKP